MPGESSGMRPRIHHVVIHRLSRKPGGALRRCVLLYSSSSIAFNSREVKSFLAYTLASTPLYMALVDSKCVDHAHSLLK